MSQAALEERIYTAIGHASVCWDDEGVFKSEEAKGIGDELVAYLKARDDLLYNAWVVIANAADWALATHPETGSIEEPTPFILAATEWRDTYHSLLANEKYEAGPFTTNRAAKRRVQKIVRRVQKVGAKK
jgi:hypothetical protein